jgi:predicted membrane-bound spermidine synthase
MKVHSTLLAFLMIILFMVSLSVLLLELTLTRLFSIILWYDYAFMVISVAFFGLGIGSLVVHIVKNKLNEENLPSRILQSTMATAISIPVMLFILGHFVPSNPSFIYVFYLSSSIPFFFAGVTVALIYLSMPKEITKLYFIDLLGAGAAALVLDPIIQVLGAESVMLSISLLVIGPSIAAAVLLARRRSQDESIATNKNDGAQISIESKAKIYGIIILGSAALLLAFNVSFNVFAIEPGISKGLHYQLAKPSEFQHLSTEWNSFSRIDVTRQIHHDYNAETTSTNSSMVDTGRSNVLASIAIDADADTPVFRWNGSYNDLAWIREYMDYLPYELLKANNTLVIGSGGGEDVLIALAGGSKNVTAVELNPLIVSKAKEFGKSAGNLYERKEVELFIDDGRRFISSSNSEYDMITIKLVDSWAAQLAGGYALSENYLYTVEAFRQYLQHLDKINGMLVMVRWNIELPRLMPLLIESLRQETGKTIQEVGKQMIVVEDRPGLYFGADNKRAIYPILVMLKNKPFTNSEISIVTERVSENDAQAFIIPGVYAAAPYDKLLMVEDKLEKNQHQLGSRHNISDYDSIEAVMGLRPPTDDSPFFFAREKIPSQMITLLITVLSVSGVLALLLIYYSRINNIHLASSSFSWLLVLFVIFIGLGFMILEITFIQKFLLLLGTPIMALTVILFSILVSSGIGAYLSGKLFRQTPQIGTIISIPVLVVIILCYYFFLQDIINSSISFEISYRIGLTFVLLAPAGILMGFQFPSIIRISSLYAQKQMKRPETENRQGDVTLLWGVNVIASVIGTVLTAIFSMVIGFNGNLLIGASLYFGAFMVIVVSLMIARTIVSKEIVE